MVVTMPGGRSPVRCRLVAAGLLMLMAWPLAELLNHGFERELRQASTAIAAVYLRAAGVAAVRSGTTLFTPWGRFEVLLPCSGGKFLATTLAVGLAALVLGTAHQVRRALLVVGLVPLAIGGNALRVAALTLRGTAHDQIAHTLLGLASFVVVTVVVAWIAGVGPPRIERAPGAGAANLRKSQRWTYSSS